jgi:DNA-binding transcriptional MerR regulator
VSDHVRLVAGLAPDEETLPVAAVARRLGVAPATLRTWDRRYGIGPRAHTTGRHRRYTHADIARLELMQHALLRGATPAEAAHHALRSAAPPKAAMTSRDGGAALLHEFSTRSAAVLGLSRAATAMDAVAAQQLLADSIEALGVVPMWDDVLRPVLVALASRLAQSGEYVEAEHLVRECALAALIGATPLVTAPKNPRPVLLCCAPEERHSLPLYVLRAALARKAIGTQMLGAALPTPALAAAVRRTGPAAVAVWAQLPRNAQPEVFAELPRTRQRVRLFACGPGWLTTELPDRVNRLDDLSDAVHRIEALVTAPR